MLEGILKGLASYQTAKNDAQQPQTARVSPASAVTAPATQQPSQQAQEIALLSGFQNMDLSGKVRSRPLSDDYMRNVSQMVRGLGDGYDIQVTSAAQDREGPHRTGSHRHDVDENGVGHTADFVLTQDGKPILPADNPQLYEQLFEAAGQRFTGVGHYDWGVHIGGGDEAFWGPDKTGASANAAWRDAWQRGRSNAGTAAETLPADHEPHDDTPTQVEPTRAEKVADAVSNSASDHMAEQPAQSPQVSPITAMQAVAPPPVVDTTAPMQQAPTQRRAAQIETPKTQQAQYKWLQRHFRGK